MQNYCKTIGALAAASDLVAGNATAEVEYELHTGYTNQYIFRGVEQGDHLLEMGLDAATTYNDLALSAGVWQADFDTNNGKVEEIDLYTEVATNLGFATGAIGYIYYNQDTGFADDAQEVYFSLSRALDYGINAALTYYWDVETDNQGYTALDLTKSIPLTSCLSCGLGTTVGYSVENSEFAHWTTTASLDWAFTETATLSPFVSVAIGGTPDSGYESDSQNELVGGSMLSVSF